MEERILVLLKPDAVERRLTGEIIGRFEKKGLKVVAIKMLTFDETLSDKHYSDHVKKAFYPALKDFITSGPCVAMVLQGKDCISLVRTMMGATSHREALPGTIRGDFAYDTTRNLVHGSDSPEKAKKEIALFFSNDEIYG